MKNRKNFLLVIIFLSLNINNNLNSRDWWPILTVPIVGSFLLVSDTVSMKQQLLNCNDQIVNGTFVNGTGNCVNDSLSSVPPMIIRACITSVCITCYFVSHVVPKILKKYRRRVPVAPLNQVQVVQ